MRMKFDPHQDYRGSLFLHLFRPTNLADTNVGTCDSTFDEIESEHLKPMHEI
jgi:hypothetical protein